MNDPAGSLKLLFATEAYSMGTDAPDVRRVVHAGVPATLESMRNINMKFKFQILLGA
jgi:superfamily II DNA/RNA helicase